MKIIYLIGFLTFFTQMSFAQEIQTTFGKSRVQYSNDFDNWAQYETENFLTYWYGKSRNVAIASIQFAEAEFMKIQNVMEHRLNDKITIIAYSDLAELYQTNIGLQSELPESLESVELIGNRLFVYFDGNHKNLRRDIKKGVAKAFLHSMLYGSSFSKVVQNTVMVDLPDWYKSGIVDYVGENWGNEDDAALRDLLHKNKIKDFKKLTKVAPELAGHAFWNYLGTQYGNASISNILYLSRINRSIPSAFRYVLGEEYADVTNNCFEFYLEKHDEDLAKLVQFDEDKIVEKTSFDRKYQHLTVNDDFTKLAYATNYNGRLNFYIKDIKSGKSKRIKSVSYNNPYRTRDDNYPIFFWEEDNRTLGVIFEENNILNIWIVDSESFQKIKNTLSPVFQRVYSADFIDQKNIVLSANINGFSDLFTYNLNQRIEKPVTKDLYDDLDVSVHTINGTKGILLSSNRIDVENIELDIDTTLIDGQFDVFFLPLTDYSKFYRITNTPQQDEMKPYVSGNELNFLTDKYGVDVVESYAIGNSFKIENKPIGYIQYSQQITDKSCISGECYISLVDGKKSVLAKTSLMEGNPQFTTFRKEYFDELEKGIDLFEVIAESKLDELDGIPKGWYFQSEYGETVKLEKEDDQQNIESEQAIKIHRFNPQRITPSRLRFKLLEIKTDLNNDPLFTGLNTFAGDRQVYTNNPLGLLMKARVDDLFEDYVFEGGVRFATNFTGYEAFLTFEDRKKKWDHFYGVYYRQSTDRRIENIPRGRKNTTLGFYKIKYPFNEFFSVSVSGTLRNDKKYTLIIDQPSYESFSFNEQRIGLRSELVFDNSSMRSINIFNGIRAKLYAEGLNHFKIQFADPFEIKPSEGFLSVFGMDARYYLPVFKKSVLAVRLAGATSLGSDRILYLLGGVEGSLFQNYDNDTPIPMDGNFVYRNLAPQMRGFDVNIRNGSSYMLSNIEFRIPIFRQLFSDQIKYDFIREFQLVGFFDVGTAWYGSSPYSEKNPINIAQLENPAVTLNIRYFRDPLVMGYGWGMRTSVFGYFLKLDYAWGLETKNVLGPKVHLSLGTDF